MMQKFLAPNSPESHNNVEAKTDKLNKDYVEKSEKSLTNRFMEQVQNAPDLVKDDEKATAELGKDKNTTLASLNAASEAPGFFLA